MFEFTNTKTNTIHRYKTRNAARKAADKIDAEYGAVICTLVRQSRLETVTKTKEVT